MIGPLTTVRVLMVLLLFFVAAVRVSAAVDGPQPPCGAAPIPAYPPPDQAPTIRVWHAHDLNETGWTPPACLGSRRPSGLVVALAGSFRSAASIPDLLGRLGAISEYPSIPYWSTSSGRWRPLAERAWAVDDLSHRRPRSELTAADLFTGLPLYYAEEDRRTGTVVYRMQTLSVAPYRVVLAVENVSPIRLYLLTLFDPGALQTVLFLQRLSPDTWGLYELTRTGPGTSLFAGGHEASYANRAAAIFNYLAMRHAP